MGITPPYSVSLPNLAQQVYSHPDRYIDFFDGETPGRRKGLLHKWTKTMAEKGTWADQLFINAIARAHEVSQRAGGGLPRVRR